MLNVIDILKERLLFDDITSPDIQDSVKSQQTVYAGFDPSSDSLGVGNLVTILALAHFQRCGHKVIALVGGATGMIGDPSGKSSERALLSAEEIEKNTAGIKLDLARLLDFDSPTAGVKMVNNADWLGTIPVLDFLRDTGKHFRMGAMLGKESVRGRMESDEGMSFTEFSYQVLQAYDFLHLYDSEGCSIQIGGSDQWGNITAGVDLVRKLRGAEAYGLTFPLICDSSGVKFGKTEGNTVFLSSDRTSYYDFYQFFFRVEDADAIRFLKVYTFMPLDEIAALEESVKAEPEKRKAQKRLAEEVTRMVHGEEGLQVALRTSAVLFGESMDGLRADDLRSIFADAPSTELPADQVRGSDWPTLASASGLCKSKGEARRLIQSGGFYVNNRRIEAIDAQVEDSDIIDGEIIVLRSGKKNIRLVKITQG
ncbi:tyrosine--tRNA ligase [Verrucomicrobiota bacterium]